MTVGLSGNSKKLPSFTLHSHPSIHMYGKRVFPLKQFTCYTMKFLGVSLLVSEFPALY